MYKIEFDEKEHKYYVDGVLKPSVSQIIRNVLKNDEPIPEYAIPAMKRGTYVHKVINMFLLETLDEASIDESVIGYFNSFKKWNEKSGLTLEYTEKILYNPDGDYCMTLDYSGTEGFDIMHLFDWKTGQIYDTYGPQLGGYYDGYQNHCKEIVGDKRCVSKLACVQLFKNGIIAKTHVYDSEKCLQDWRAINRVYKMKKGGL